jgi:arabinofuranosyltransferase
LLLAAASLLTTNVFASVFVLSIGMSLVVFWICVARIPANRRQGALVGGILICSKAYVDYSTSGLENPLSHLLILLAILAAIHELNETSFRARTVFFSLYFLTYMSRPDLPLLLIPLAVVVAYRNRAQPVSLAKSISLGLVPVVAWTLFALYYYGFPFPNTAYAKLGTGVPLRETLTQGGRYLLDSVSRDPLTLAVIAAGTTIGFISAGSYARAIALGVWLYIAYVVGIGGDFMSGRFFAAPLLVAAILIARSAIHRTAASTLAVLLAGLALFSIDSTLLSGAAYTNRVIGSDGISDERGFYFKDFGLTTFSEGAFDMPSWDPQITGLRVMNCGGLGWEGIHSGPGIHEIDTCALADPLLARLPAKYNANWRIGHFVRELPEGYVESVEKNANLLSDADTRKYYDSIRRVTRDDLNELSRIREIVLMNLGQVKKPDLSRRSR